MATISAQARPIEFKAENESSFWISKQEWFTVQMYIEIGLLLPKTPAEIPFDDILATYMEIQTHCRTWKESIYPSTLQLASELSDYSQTAKNYYGALKKLLPNLQSGNLSESAEKEFNLIVEHLDKEMNNYHQKAKATSESIGQLRQDCFLVLKKLYQLHAIYNFQSDYSSTSLALLWIKFLKEILGSTLAVIDKIYQLWQFLEADINSLKMYGFKEHKTLSEIWINESIIKLENISKYAKELKPIF